VSRYQNSKTNLDFTEARDIEWQWHQLGHMQVCTSLQTDNHASIPPLSFLQAGCPSCRPTNSVKALKALNVYTARILRAAGSMKRTSVRPSVCVSANPVILPPHTAAASLLLRARRPGDIERLLHGRHSAANARRVTLSADIGRPILGFRDIW